MELFKYVTLEFKTRLLAFFNRILNGKRPPESRNIAFVIPFIRKGIKITQKVTDALAY
jgi:hypothetical protein